MVFNNFISGTVFADFLYSFVIILISLIIYFSTKEMYELSSYKAMKYFREAFLFFALAFFFRIFIDVLLVVYEFAEAFSLSPNLVGLGALFFFMYSSTMAIFYLLYSVLWKNLKKYKFMPLILNLVAVIISAVSILLSDVRVILLFQIFIFLFMVILNYLVYLKSKTSKIKRELYSLYLFLFVFWVLNIFDLLSSHFYPFIELVVYAVSVVLFVLVLYKVVKRVGWNGKESKIRDNEGYLEDYFR